MIYWFAALTANAATATLMVPSPPAAPPPSIVIMPSPRPEPQPPKKGVESPAIPKNFPGIWANTSDYPSKALQEEREGITAFRVTVSNDGSVTNCKVTESSGHTDLDDVTCSNVSKRATFYPAQDKKGRPVEGSYANRVRWQIPVMASNASFPILRDSLPRPPQILKAAELRVEKADYPSGALAAGEQGITTFALDIDLEGKVNGCDVVTSSGSVLLDQQSCVVAQKWSFEPARNIDGKPTFGKSRHTLNWRLPKGTPRVTPSPLRPVTNPFEKEGSITLNLEFDDKGKLVDCALESKGEFPLFGGRDIFSNRACKDGFGRDVRPFLDANGVPEAKRVILHMGIDHETPSSKSTQEPARVE